ncbi:MAG: DNA methyltransferase [bacterium JZ-2024 1]
METIQKFQELLKKLFQFESSDLDFGIYRILNYKRDRIEKFIDEDLKNKVETAFAKHKDERLTEINEEFEKVKKKVIQSLGEDAFTSTGDLKEEFKNTPIGKDYLSIKAQKDEAEKIEEIKNQVFNDLYNFFSRYYEEGDFVPQYRYSIKGHKYAIPYSGEEVKLYWANQDQYYIKTGLLFRDYTFKIENYKIIFRIVEGKEEPNPIEEKKKRFMLNDENPVEFDKENKILIIKFQYKELSEKEIKHHKLEKGTQTPSQEKIDMKSYEKIMDEIEDNTLKGLLIKEYKNQKPLLLYQLNRFTAKNTKDFFIHKNLKNFLFEQLDYFIKSEVLDIETLEKEKFLDKHITRAKVVKEIGEDIIDFLFQIEDFQKRLWEKKKFVIKTEYVITLDKIKEYAGEDFLNEVIEDVLKNEKQLNEWRELGFGEIKSKDDLLLKNNLLDKTYKKLPIDTKYFSEDFKEKMLEKLTEKHDLDDILDGLLIKSENWQALNLILNKYKEKVQTIYIDPPYNTGSDEFLYRDRYQHSSWLSMMENRLSLAKELMRDDGIIFVSIDDNEVDRLKIVMMQSIFGENKFLENFIWNNTQTPPSLSDVSRKNVEYILTFTKERITEKLKGRLAEGNDSPLLNRGNPLRELEFMPGKVRFNIPDG